MNFKIARSQKIILRVLILLLIFCAILNIYRDGRKELKSFLTEKIFGFKNNDDIKKSTKNIFFIETSFQSENGSFVLNPRAACAIESAARINPYLEIFVLFTASKQFTEG
jgi:hypothetical protein